jgi:hypothetical protein
MPAVMTAAGTPAFEALTATISTTAIGTTAAVAASTGAAERPLESRTRVAANAGGIARKIVPSRGRATGARSARLSWKENSHVLGDSRFRDGLTRCRGGNDFGFGVKLLDFESLLVTRLFLAGLRVRGLFLFGFAVVELVFMMLAQGSGMFGGFLRHVRSKVGTIGSAAGLYFGNFFLRKT